MPERSDVPRIWGDLPARNPNFVGRESLLLALQWSLRASSKVAVFPEPPYDFGGIGTTELTAEFAYRFAGRYDLVWWIPADQQSLVLRSLADLGRRLGVPATQDLPRTAELVIEALSSTRLRWLLVYDHAGEPDDLVHLIPSTGGHVVLTSRNKMWSSVWDGIGVGALDRAESIALIQRGATVSAGEADRLAETLGDLPLAVELAARWQDATGMSAADYLERLDRYRQRLPVKSRPHDCPAVAVAVVALALDDLRQKHPAAARLFEMFAVLGPAPISTDLLLQGRDGGAVAPPGSMPRDPSALRQAARYLRWLRLANIDARGRIEVPRLTQAALRQSLDASAQLRSRAEVHQILGAANPGAPSSHPLHAEINAHLIPSGLIDADGVDDRRLVLDQIRYLRFTGDHEGARRLGDAAVQAWTRRTDQPDTGPNGELTLLVMQELALALLALGMEDRAGNLAEDVADRLRDGSNFGTGHEHAFHAADVVVHCHRVAGRYDRALDLDLELAGRSRGLVGDEDVLWLRRLSSLALDRRLLGGFQGAHDLDTRVVRVLERTAAEEHPLLLAARSNLVRDLHGLGRYAESLRLQERVLAVYRRILPDPKHPEILLGAHAEAVALRKTGRYADALRAARTIWHDCTVRYGDSHPHSLAATMTYANTLRVNGRSGEMQDLALKALMGYRRVLGWSHPMSQVAMVNAAAALRSLGDVAAARSLDEDAHSGLVAALGPMHGYTLCAASGLANDLALSGEADAAAKLAAETLATSEMCRGPGHPYTLSCAVDAASSETSRRAAIDALADVLGSGHPEVNHARLGGRAELDIESAPTVPPEAW